MPAKKFILNLPLKVILTEEGTSYFISNKKKLLRIRLADNVEEYGISLNPFSPQSIQNMIMLDYISKLEVSLSDFDHSRQEIIDLSKLVVYSILYKQFDRQVFADLIKCDCVRKHNRTHPNELIDERTKMDGRQLRAILSKQEVTIKAAKKMILDPVWKFIMENKEYTFEEKNIYLLMSEKFLNRMMLMNWYIIVKFFKDQEAFAQINVAVRHILQTYMEKSRIAEHASSALMELVTNAEKRNLMKEAKRMYAGVDDVASLLYDSEVRAKVASQLKINHELVTLSWKLGGGSTAIGKQGRLQLTILNKNDDYQEQKENIEAKMAADTKKRSLIDFYRELPDDEESTQLGLLWLPLLDDACKKVNVKFESIVNQFSENDLTVINLIFNF